MIDDKTRAEIDQATAALVEMLPPVCWGLYCGNVKEGFTEAQAMRLVEVYIAAFLGRRMEGAE